MTRCRWSRFGVAAFLVAAPPAAAAEDQAALAAILEETRAELKMPGLRAAVRFPDGRVVRAAVGLADREANLPLDDRVRMPGGSTGKTFVAALTMLLVEDGVLSLDDPASKWLGDRDWYRRLPNADEIRVRHLLSHSAGLGDYPGTMRFRIGMVWRAIRRERPLRTRGTDRFHRPEAAVSGGARLRLHRRRLSGAGTGDRGGGGTSPTTTCSASASSSPTASTRSGSRTGRRCRASRRATRWAPAT